MSQPQSRPKLLVCNCQRTMEIDGKALARALGADRPLTVHTELCRAGLPAFEAALAGDAPVLVACTQEAPLFREVAEERGRGDASLGFLDIREKAGWCESRSAVLPKMAALLAEAQVTLTPTGRITLRSEGMCLVYGSGDVALEAARELASRLTVTLLLRDAGGAMPPSPVEFPIYRGRIVAAKGHLGAFEITVDGHAPMLPSSRRTLDFAMGRSGVASRCDLIVDLSGGTPLFAGGARRDGYLRADPGSPVAVARTLLAATDLIGEFEKPLYVAYDAGICAHARSGKTGCSKCLEHCPTGAISPDGDGVRIDAAVCGGCGNCGAVCPTGAIAHAFPSRRDALARAQTLLATYLAAGGRRPAVLVHDERHGTPLIAATARFGRGLPAHVLPFSLDSVLGLGHELMAAMLTAGAEHVAVLVSPEHPEELAALQDQMALLRAILGGLGHPAERLHLLDDSDPAAVEAALHALPDQVAIACEPMLAAGSKRDIARTALGKLRSASPTAPDVIALPTGAPYGRIAVRTEGCTLCLSCVGACPANALADNPDRPELAFTEATCVQCGLCVATCPEKVITLEPRYNFASAALSPTLVKGEEPFHCIVCNKAFGTKSTIDKVLARLEGRHAMFKSREQLRLIQMCDTCRVVTLSEQGNDPMRLGQRPRVRTTDDYTAAEAEAKRTGRSPEDFLE